MKKKRITYGVSGMMEFQAVVKVGRSKMKVLFTDGSLTAYGVNPAIYTTDNLMVQHAIENSDHFKRGRIHIVNTVVLDEEVKIDRNTKQIPPPVTLNCPAYPPLDNLDGNQSDGSNEAERSTEEVVEETNPSAVSNDEEQLEEVSSFPEAENDTKTISESDSISKADNEVTSLTPMEFDNNDDAKDFLVSKFGIVRSKLRVRADIIAVGEANGIAISFS